MIYRFKNGKEKPIVAHAALFDEDQLKFMDSHFKDLSTNARKVDKHQKALFEIDENKDVIAISAEDYNNLKTFEDFDCLNNAILAKAAELTKQGRKVGFIIDGCSAHKEVGDDDRIEYTFDVKHMSELSRLDTILRDNLGQELRFNELFKVSKYSDLKKSWTCAQVLHANSEINKVVNEIKEMKLSPYETMVYIHKYISENYVYYKHYTDSTAKYFIQKADAEASIVSTMLDNKTQCTGFASMTKAIVDRLNIPQLKCKTKTILIRKNIGEPGFHCINTIEIDDPKYAIQGVYLTDSTQTESKEAVLFSVYRHLDGRRVNVTSQYPKKFLIDFSYFMYPVSDTSNFIGHSYKDFTKTSTRWMDFYYENNSGERAVAVEGKQGGRIPFQTLERALVAVYTKQFKQADFDKINDMVDADMSHTKTWFKASRDILKLGIVGIEL